MRAFKDKRGVLAFLLVLVILPGVSVVWAEDALDVLRQTSRAFTEVAKKAVPAVVSVQTETSVITGSGQRRRSFEEEFFELFGFGARQRTPHQQKYIIGQGSGFIVSTDGYIMTNNHVVGNADKITVNLNDGRSFDAKIVGSDPRTDVAIIKIESENLPMVELGDSDRLEIGEWVIAVGNPFGLTATVTVGVVSAKGRSGFGVIERGGYEDFIQTDAAINPGNSGGPLLDLDGKVVGINTFIYSQSGGYMGIGFAVPVNMAKSIKNQLLATGEFARGYLGVSGIDATDGVIITSVGEDSPADKAGLKDRDVIQSINGRQVRSFNELKGAIASKEPGTKVEIRMTRKGKEYVKTAKLISRPKSEMGKKLGMQVQDLTRDLARRFGYDSDEGVLVAEIEKGSPADREGIEPGMVIIGVNLMGVNSVEDFHEALIETDKTKKALLIVKFGRNVQYVLLSVE